MYEEMPADRRGAGEIEDIESDNDEEVDYLEQKPPPQAASQAGPRVPGIQLGGLGQVDNKPGLPAGFNLKMPVAHDNQPQDPLPVKKLGIPSLNMGGIRKEEH